MKLLFLLLACISTTVLHAQIAPEPGVYSSEDGYYSITIAYKKDEKVLTIVEPNKTSNYTFVSGNEYRFVNPTNGIEYLIEVLSTEKFAAYKPGNKANRSLFYFTGNASTPATKKEFIDYSKIAEKYKEKMKTDPKDAQLWSLCAAAANARSSFSKEGFEEYVAKIVPSIKAILEKKDKCPCTDAIDQSTFDKY
ncbi:hypothetical protein ESA94_10120 [Lacibacter luteus]|uniref:DUF4369 domain-containing protein n=1 Tax=Lacibacter luteus TaxID=2508719 RepID=A0A4Q1CK77_9BACT|nr:hypothetical protein [Lacibacter luteus]RXK60807.1 hypothetical protein ESA94_10120 [Lacibacter luteus]